MKTYAHLTIASLLTLGSLNAMAASRSQSVINSPVVTSLATLLNQKHNGACHVPANDSDVEWRCMGALMPVDKPTIEGSGCFFSLKITCPDETADISGETTMYLLVNPDGKVSDQTASSIVFSQISIK